MSKKLNILILYKSYEHLQLWFFSLLIALIIGASIGYLLAKSKREKLSEVILSTLSLFQTIPGLAFIALIEVLFIKLKPIISLPTTGFLPGILALIFYALLPILKNTYMSFKQIDRDNYELGYAIGMQNRHLFYYVELPLCIPLILTGLRISSVSTFGLVTLTSLVGSGGLGDLIFQGLRRFQVDLVLAGTIPVIVMAILGDIALYTIEKWLSGVKKDATA